MPSARHVVLGLMSLILPACGGGGGSNLAPTTYSVGGHVAGLTGSGLALSFNGGAAVAVSHNGAFVATSSAGSGSMYSVTVSTQPSNPAQTCTVSNGSGTVNGNVASISVYCPQSVGSWLYVATAGSITLLTHGTSIPGSLSAYAINTTSGAVTLVPGSMVSTGPAVGQLQFVPHSTYLWSLSFGSNGAEDNNVLSSLYVYSVNAETGVPTPSATNPSYTLDGTITTATGTCNGPNGLTGFGSTAGISFAPSGAFGYAFNLDNMAANNLGTWVFTQSLGQPSALGPVAAQSCITSLTIDPSGQFAYYLSTTVSGSGAYQIVAASVDSSSGVLTTVSGTTPLPVGGGHSPPTVDPFGRFVYVADGDTIYGFAINPSNGALTAMPGSPFPFSGASSSLLIAPDGRFAYVVAIDGIYTFAIDASSGALTSVGSPLSLQISYANQLTYVTSEAQIDPSGQFLYVSAAAGPQEQGVYAYSLDASSGALTVVSGSPFAVTSQPGQAWPNSAPLQLAIIN
jgi:hypothetical protein